MGKFTHITPALKELHWLPVKKRIDFKVLLTVFKALKGDAPDHIQDMLMIQNKFQRDTRSSRKQFILEEKRADLVTMGDRAFSIAGPKLWNKLPDDIRNINLSLDCLEETKDIFVLSINVLKIQILAQ